MPSTPESPPPIASILLRALLYALAIALLVIFWPADPQVFIYQNF